MRGAGLTGFQDFRNLFLDDPKSGENKIRLFYKKISDLKQAKKGVVKVRNQTLSGCVNLSNILRIGTVKLIITQTKRQLSLQ